MTETPHSAALPSNTHETIPQHLWQFAQEQDALARAAVDIQSYLRELGVEGSVQFHTIEARAKSLASYADKATRVNSDGTLKYSDPATDFDDCVAARVIVFTTRARQDFVELLVNRCTVGRQENPGDRKHNGYDSDHLIVSGLRDPSSAARYPALAGYFRRHPGLEIQIRTVAGHAWAEYEHDVRYKSTAYKNLGERDKARVDQWFIEAGGFRRYLDQTFNEIDEFLLPTDAAGAGSAASDEPGVEPLDEGDDRKLDEASLTELVAERYPGSEPGAPAAFDELLGHLTAMDVNRVSDLEEILAHNGGNDVADRMDYSSSVTGVRQLDDELLAALTQRYVETATSDERQQLLRLRMRRVNGRFAIYDVQADGTGATGTITAARAVRELARLVATREGLDAVKIDGWIATDPHDLVKSTHPRLVKAASGPIYVATNLSRKTSEWLMSELVERLPAGSVRVLRAGDQFVPDVRTAV